MPDTIYRHPGQPAGQTQTPDRPGQPPQDPGPAPGRPEPARTVAAVSVLFGAVGLFVFNLIFGPLAIGLAVTALRRLASDPAPARARAAAWAGLALGAADLIVLAVLLAISLAHGAVTWHFGA